MNWKFWKREEKKKIIDNIKIKTSKEYQYPCEGCVALPGGCRQLCDKVEMDNDKLRKAGEQANRNKKNLTCPDCGGQKWYDGPCGGMSQNIKCGKCGHWFNYGGPFGFTERIHLDENGRVFD